MERDQQHTPCVVHRVGTWDRFSRASITAGVAFTVSEECTVPMGGTCAACPQILLWLPLSAPVFCVGFGSSSVTHESRCSRHVVSLHSMGRGGREGSTWRGHEGNCWYFFFVLNPSFPCCGFCIFPWGRAGDTNTQLVGPRELHPTLGHLQEVGFALK